ncbi:MAG TPA: hypothetical protein VKT22_05570 [Steroidobacteraceae bacterium]|nr:hypothetical protein [Steroidobacteraceae bacterium]
MKASAVASDSCSAACCAIAVRGESEDEGPLEVVPAADGLLCDDGPLFDLDFTNLSWWLRMGAAWAPRVG